MLIKEICINNFRIYYGGEEGNYIRFDLSDQSKNIYIISGKNGFGKTTFLMSLVWCLYGKQMSDVDELYAKEINEQGGYAKYISSSLNRLAFNEGTRQAEVSITFTDISIEAITCKEIKIIRRLNLNASDFDSVQILVDNERNELADEIGPEFFIRDYILPKEIAKFFLFDAEKIVSLAEAGSVEQRKKLSHAYSEVLGIKKYVDLKDSLVQLQIKFRQQSAGQAEKKQLIDIGYSIDNAKIALEQAQRDISADQLLLGERQFDLQQYQDRLMKAGSSITQAEIDELRVSLARTKEVIEETSRELQASFEYIPFAVAGLQLLTISEQLEKEHQFKSTVYQRDKLKETEDSFLSDFREIYLRRKPLTISHEIDEFYTAEVKKLVKKHFLTDNAGDFEGLSILHEFSETERNEFNALLKSLRTSFKETFVRLNSSLNLARNEETSIRRKLSDAESKTEDPIITGWKQKRDEIQKDIESLSRNIGANTHKVDLLAESISSDTRKQLEITKNIKASTANKEKDDIVTRQIESIKNVINLVRERKKHSLQEQILKSLHKLMHKANFVASVNVSILTDDIEIKLLDAKGIEIRKESLSKGEQQMYATSLLYALVEESEIEFPIFIDSPLQKFDEQHAKNMIQYLYPEISRQVVIFPLINKEMNAEEYNLLLPHIAQTWLIENKTYDQSCFCEVSPLQFLAQYSMLYGSAN